MDYVATSTDSVPFSQSSPQLNRLSRSIDWVKPENMRPGQSTGLNKSGFFFDDQKKWLI